MAETCQYPKVSSGVGTILPDTFGPCGLPALHIARWSRRGWRGEALQRTPVCAYHAEAARREHQAFIEPLT